MEIKDIMNMVSKYGAKYHGENIVGKFSGKLTGDNNAWDIFEQAIAIKSLGANVCLVHGGGKQINNALKKEGIVSGKLKDGSRNTTPEILAITNEILGGVNIRMSTIFNEVAHSLKSKISPLGMAGFYGGTAIAERAEADTLTGRITTINNKLLLQAMENNMIPIVYPICKGDDDGMLNVNADNLATEIAKSVKARRLILCSDVNGIHDKNGDRIPNIDTNMINILIENETIKGGMVTKALECQKLVKNHDVGGIVILDGGDPTAIWDELYSDKGSGTLIRCSHDM